MEHCGMQSLRLMSLPALLSATLLFGCAWKKQAENDIVSCQYRAALLGAAACTAITDPNQKSACTAAVSVITFEDCWKKD